MTGYGHIELSYVVPVYQDQGRGGVVESLLAVYAGYDPEVTSRIQFVVVDDASPLPVQLPEKLGLNVLLLRVTRDIPWNQPGARNLGVVLSRSDKLLMTDVDHEFPEKTLRYLLAKTCPQRHMYKLERREWDGEWVNPHPNTFLLCRSTFLRHFGYDEEFVGRYGWDDLMFIEWQRYNGTRFFTLPRRYPVLHRNIDRERGYHSLQRDDTENRRLAAEKRRQCGVHGRQGGHSRLFLNFPWELVSEQRAEPPSVSPSFCTRFWRPLWPLRWLVGG
jgi:hypothetical protein